MDTIIEESHEDYSSTGLLFGGSNPTSFVRSNDPSFKSGAPYERPSLQTKPDLP